MCSVFVLSVGSPWMDLVRGAFYLKDLFAGWRVMSSTVNTAAE